MKNMTALRKSIIKGIWYSEENEECDFAKAQPSSWAITRNKLEQVDFKKMVQLCLFFVLSSISLFNQMCPKIRPWDQTVTTTCLFIYGYTLYPDRNPIPTYNPATVGLLSIVLPVSL